MASSMKVTNYVASTYSSTRMSGFILDLAFILWTFLVNFLDKALLAFLHGNMSNILLELSLIPYLVLLIVTGSTNFIILALLTAILHNTWYFRQVLH